MSDPDTPALACATAQHVWSIPHVRLAVFRHILADNEVSSPNDLITLDTCGIKERAVLKQYLTVDQSSFRDVVFLLYADIHLDQFPCDCPCQNRVAVYAAGVRDLCVGGCLPLCSRWACLADMIRFFPNLSKVHFPTTQTSYHTRGAVESGIGELVFQELLGLQEDNVDRPPQHRYLPEGLDYKCWYQLYCCLPTLQKRSLFKAKSDGNATLVDVLLLPASDMLVWGFPGQSSEWLSMMEYRTQNDIPTRDLKWQLQSVSEIEQLAPVLPTSLRKLYLRCSVNNISDITEAANTMMSCINNEQFPALRHLQLRLDFHRKVLRSAPSSSESITPAWMQNEMPSKLATVSLELFCTSVDPILDDDDLSFDYEDLSLSDDLSSYDVSDVSHVSASDCGQLYLEAVPKEWVLNVRRKLGEDFRLSVIAVYHDEEGMKDIHPTEHAYIDHLLDAPLSEL